MSNMADVVIVGSCVQDLTSYTPRFPKPGESVRGSRFATGFGGKGANQAVMAARLGISTAMVGMVGDDMFGPPTIENFKAHGVNADFVKITDLAGTATATITVCESGQNSIVVVLGANEKLTKDDIRAAEEVISKAKIIVCQLEIPQEVTLEAMKIANKHGISVLFNPAPGLPDLNKELIEYSDIVCPNENEAEILTGLSLETVDDAKKILVKLLEMGAKTALITLGEKGCIFGTKEEPEPKHVKCIEVKATDTTGAGDAFVGTLAYFTVTYPDLTLAERIRRASLVASYSVQFPGTQVSYPYKKDLDASLFCK